MATRTKAEVLAYLEKHDLQKKMETALNTVLTEMPADPMAALGSMFSAQAVVPEGGKKVRYNTLRRSPDNA